MFKSAKTSSLLLGLGVAFALSTSAYGETATNGTASQWKELCADSSAACIHARTAQGMETYHVCAKGKCYVVLCNEHSPNAICLRDDLPGMRPMPKRYQASVFGLL
jgi:hypothetical protein